MTWSAPAEKETSFRQAIVENRVNVVRSFLGPDHVSFDAPSTWPGYGTDLFMTPLEYAARQNQARVVQILVEEFNANKELSAEPGYTPLLISLSKGNVEMIECLLRAGANVRAADGRRGRTALMHAILGNLEDSHRGIPDLLTPIPTRVTELNAYLVRMRGPRERVVRQLLARGASVHSMDANGETALIHAIRKYDYGVFNAIMESCPNVNASDNSGLSALSLSILADHDTCANRLLDRGAEPNVIDANGNSALILSIKGRQYSSVTRLIERGADPNAVDENGMSPLILSIKANEYSYVTRLLDRGADPNVTDENGIFALILSIRANEYSYVTRLLDRGANPNVTDENGNSALILSIQAKEYSYVTRLLDRGAEPNVTDKNGISALILSIQESEYSYVTRLLQKGADPNARDMNTGRSPLIVAVRANEEAMVRRLLEHGANPNSADGTDQTPLMYAAKLRIDDHHQQMNQQLNRINQRMRQLEQLVEQRMEQHMEQLVGANFARRRRRRRDERDPTITGIIPLLVAYGAEINTARVRDGHSALTLASRDGILEHVTTLLSFDNTDCDRALVTGETALILAARGGHDDVIGLLMGKGACVDAAALDGLTGKKSACALEIHMFSSVLTKILLSLY